MTDEEKKKLIIESANMLWDELTPEQREYLSVKWDDMPEVDRNLYYEAWATRPGTLPHAVKHSTTPEEAKKAADILQMIKYSFTANGGRASQFDYDTSISDILSTLDWHGGSGASQKAPRINADWMIDAEELQIQELFTLGEQLLLESGHNYLILSEAGKIAARHIIKTRLSELDALDDFKKYISDKIKQKYAPRWNDFFEEDSKTDINNKNVFSFIECMTLKNALEYCKQYGYERINIKWICVKTCADCRRDYSTFEENLSFCGTLDDFNDYALLEMDAKLYHIYNDLFFYIEHRERSDFDKCLQCEKRIFW